MIRTNGRRRKTNYIALTYLAKCLLTNNQVYLRSNKARMVSLPVSTVAKISSTILSSAVEVQCNYFRNVSGNLCVSADVEFL